MDVLIPLDRAAEQPLRDQVYMGVRAAILDGRLPPGARLASTRELARQLGVARFTIDDAYDRLASEGYTEGRRGSGTYVGNLDALMIPPKATTRTTPRATPPASRVAAKLSQWGKRLPTVTPDLEPEPRLQFNFHTGTPALDAFPAAIWQRLQARETRTREQAHYDYGASAGLPALRAAIADYLARSRGVRCTPEQVVVTSGTRQSIDLLARVLLDPGDTAIVEDPGYPATRLTLDIAGARVEPLPVDGDGLRVAALPEHGKPAKLVCVTPSHQYPTGGVLSLARRLELLQWAERTGTLIVEDDYDSELRYGARPVPALAALVSEPSKSRSAGGNVAYVGTFSKVLFPALRLGYVVLPPDLVGPFAMAKNLTDRHAPTLLQATAAAFMAEGHFERPLARTRHLYADRQAALLDALDTHLCGLAERHPFATTAGLHFLVRFAVDMPEDELIRRAAAAGIGLDGASSCFVTPPTKPHIMLGYAALPEEQIRDGIRRLAHVVSQPQ